MKKPLKPSDMAKPSDCLCPSNRVNSLLCPLPTRISIR